MLIELARTMPGLILTTDAPLTKLAKIQSVAVVNMHDIQAAMKPAVIPGEPLTLRLVKPGEQPGQGVGFLDDGTMVVAEDGGPYIGREVMLVVVSTLQTAAGRMVFARTARRDEEHAGQSPSHSQPPAAVARAEVDENDVHQSDEHESAELEAPVTDGAVDTSSEDNMNAELQAKVDALQADLAVKVEAEAAQAQASEDIAKELETLKGEIDRLSSEVAARDEEINALRAASKSAGEQAAAIVASVGIDPVAVVASEPELTAAQIFNSLSGADAVEYFRTNKREIIASAY
jgi:hypothetical protein